MKFIINPVIEKQPGWLWVNSWLAAFDLSKITRFTFNFSPKSTDFSAISGSCIVQRKNPAAGPFRLVCRVHRTHWPAALYIYEQPIYRNTDGSWPSLPPDLLVTGHQIRAGREWLSAVSQTELASLDEAIVFITGHEMFHFLRFTKQVAGINRERHADRFALNLVEKYRLIHQP